MKKPNQRIGADVVKSDLVELHKSTSNKSATYALHFDTQETNQFCDFTENIQNLISGSKVAHGSVTISTPHTTTAIIINESETGYINDFKRKLEELIPSDSLIIIAVVVCGVDIVTEPCAIFEAEIKF